MFRHHPTEQDTTGFRRLDHGSVSLLVPDLVVDAILEEREKARHPVYEMPAPKAEVPEPAAPVDGADILPSEPFRPATYSVEVFSEAAVDNLVESSKRRDSDSRDRVKVVVKALRRQGGQRFVLDLEADVIEAIVTSLRRRFPNFHNVINHLEVELSLGMASSPEAFRIAPILLYGGPGIGKTAFARYFAKLLGVGFDIISAAGMQGSFDLVGTSGHWSTSTPGRVFDLQAYGEYACPVLVVDEIDKIGNDDKNPIVPAFLELLEPLSAQDFLDQSVNIRFDASKIIIIATANEINAIPAPLLSRFHAIEVSAPTAEERRLIATSIFLDIVKGLLVDVRILDDALDRLATAQIDIRALARALREAIGRVIREGKDVVGIDDLNFECEVGRSRIGFV